VYTYKIADNKILPVRLILTCYMWMPVRCELQQYQRLFLFP